MHTASSSFLPPAKHQGYPIVPGPGHLATMDAFTPGWCLVPAQLLGPLLRFLKDLPSSRPQGELARALELLLIGLDEGEVALQKSALARLNLAVGVTKAPVPVARPKRARLDAVPNHQGRKTWRWGPRDLRGQPPGYRASGAGGRLDVR